MSDQELKLKITVDKDGALTGIESVKAAEESLKNQNQLLGASFTELNSALELVGKGFNALKGLVSTAIEIINKGSQIDDVTQAFERLSNQAGVVADVFLRDLNRATGETLDNLTLLSEANKALQRGLTAEQFTTVAAAARELSDTLGTDLLAEMEQISQALATGNARTLQNKLGIIDLEAAEKQFAETLGIKREALTREQQLLAARQAILEAATDEAERGLRIEADAADLIQQITKFYRDQNAQIAKTVATYPELNEALKTFRDLMKQINWAKLGEQVGLFFANVIDSANVLISSFVNVRKNFELFKLYLDSTFSKTMDGVSDRTKDLRVKFLELKAVLPNTTENVKKLEGVLGELYTEIVDVNEAVKATGEPPFPGYKDSLQEIADEFDDLYDQLKQFKNEASEPVDLIVRGPGGKPISSGVTGGGGGGGGSSRGFLQDLFGADDQTWKQVSDDLKRNIQEATARAIGDGLRAALNGNSEDVKSVFKQFGADAGRAGGQALGALIAGPFGAMVGGELGSVLGEKLGKGVFNAFNHVFGGGRSEETKARKAVETWFDKLLKDLELKILKDGKLEDLTNFSRMQGGFQAGWQEEYKALTGDLNDFFDSLGKGFLAITDQFKEIGDQIGFLIADNFGGSLNNLQLFFYKSGITIDEWRDQLVKAFLDGDISAQTFNNSLFDMKQVMQDGIPMATGATAEAFENLVNSGGRGLAAIDALRDIIIEGIEAGATSFEDVKNQLLETGIAADQVELLFAQIERLGIWGFQPLLEGSDELLINLIANLESTGFVFGDMQDNVDELSERLDDLERGREIDITLNVTTNADARSRVIIDSGALPGVN